MSSCSLVNMKKLLIILTVTVAALSFPQARRKPSRTPNGGNYDELLQDPGFGAFLEELHSRYSDVQKAAALTSTTTTEEAFQFFPRFQPTEQPIESRPSNIFVSLNQDSQTTRPANPVQAPFLHSFTSTQRPRHISRNNPTTPSSDPLGDFQRTLNEFQNQQPAAQPTRIAPAKPRQEQEQEFQEQARSAQYKFASAIDDTLSGQSHQREEVRDGLKVKGKYSYSDGYFLRTVEYEADEKGYRVVNESAVSIGDGPQINPDGNARVATYVDGNSVKYQITGDDIKGPTKHKQVFSEGADELE